MARTQAKLVATDIPEVQRWLHQTKTHALKREQAASPRERAALALAYDSSDESLWRQGDQLLGLIEDQGWRYKRVMLCKAIEGAADVA